MYIRSVTLLAVLAAFAQSTGADAACGNRPGTPDLVDVFPAFTENPGEILVRYNFRSTERGSGVTSYYDIEVTDAAGKSLDKSRTGHGPFKTSYRGWVSTTFPVAAGTQYCFRVRARTAGGTQGCVSQIWSGKVCTTAPTAEIHNTCKAYAKRAYEQANAVQSMQPVGDCDWRTISRWTRQIDDHYKWCAGVRGAGNTSDLLETQERDRLLKSVCRPRGAVATPVKAPVPSPSAAPVVSASVVVASTGNVLSIGGSGFAPGARVTFTGTVTSRDGTGRVTSAALGLGPVQANSIGTISATIAANCRAGVQTTFSITARDTVRNRQSVQSGASC